MRGVKTVGKKSVGECQKNLIFGRKGEGGGGLWGVWVREFLEKLKKMHKSQYTEQIL